MSYKKYYLYKEEISFDSGVTWEDTDIRVPSGNPIGTYNSYGECVKSSIPEAEIPSFVNNFPGYKYVYWSSNYGIVRVGYFVGDKDDTARFFEEAGGTGVVYPAWNGYYHGDECKIGSASFREGLFENITGGSFSVNNFECNIVFGEGITTLASLTHGSDYDKTNFHDVKKLNVYLPNSLLTIQTGAFKAGGTRLESIETLVLPPYLSTIESDSMPNVKNLYLTNPIPPVLNDTTFTVYDSIYVPTGCLETYKHATGWSNNRYINKIKEF